MMNDTIFVTDDFESTGTLEIKNCSEYVVVEWKNGRPVKIDIREDIIENL